MLAACGDNVQGDDWLIDSGAYRHMTPEKNSMTGFVQFKKPLQIKLADNSVLLSYGKGNVKLSMFDGSKKIELTLSYVLFLPKIRKKLVSLPTMTERGAEVRFKEQSCTVIIDGKMFCIGHKYGKLYKRNDQTTHAFGV